MINGKKFIREVLKAKKDNVSYIEIICEKAKEEDLCIYEISDIIKKDKTFVAALKNDCVKFKMMEGKTPTDLGAIFNED